MEENPDFSLEDAGVSFGRPALKYARRIFPMDGGEGHFAARLRKCGQAQKTAELPSKSNPDQRVLEFYDSIFKNRPFGENIEIKNNKIIILPENYDIDFRGLPVLRAGVVLGELVKNRIESHHSAFTAAKAEQCAQTVDLDVDSAEVKAYLHGEEIAVPSTIKGYCAVCVNGMTLGFGKASNGRLKNKYPKGLRTL